MGAWYGSKATTGLSQAIVGLMPPHDTYIETHLGGGAIMKRKPPALRSIGIDLNARSIGTLCCDYEVELVHGCCHRFLADYPFEGNELVYSDPPYLMSTRKSQRRYRYHNSDADHEALLGLPGGLPCSVMISGYPSALYDSILKDWHSVSVQSSRRHPDRARRRCRRNDRAASGTDRTGESVKRYEINEKSLTAGPEQLRMLKNFREIRRPRKTAFGRRRVSERHVFRWAKEVAAKPCGRTFGTIVKIQFLKILFRGTFFLYG